MKARIKNPFYLPVLILSLGLMLAGNATAQTYNVLKSFAGYTDGGEPYAGVTLSGSTLYGTTWTWGYYGNGIVFKINTDGSGYQVLQYFLGTNGAGPYAGVTLSGSTLYGTTSDGGANNNGTVYKVNTDGTGFAMIYSFSAKVSGANSDGANPEGSLTLSGSTLYGTTFEGGTNGDGTVFKINTDGSGFNVIKTFTGSDGAGSYAGVILSGSTIYGTTTVGGTNGSGTVFKVNTDGTGFSVLKNFNDYGGSFPSGSLTLSGSTLYGTTQDNGSSSGYGTVFRINTDGTGFAVLHSFSEPVHGTNSDGSSPEASLTLSGSTLYGTTLNGGSGGRGTIFEVNTDGSGFTVLKNFVDSADGGYSQASLTLSGSTLYGTTHEDGSSDEGTIFSLTLEAISSPLQITTILLPSGANGENYSQTLTATGGQAPYSWTNISGALPPGLTLSTNGVISGTPAFTGTSNLIVMVTDAASNTATQTLTLTINTPTAPVFQSAKLTNGQFMLTWSAVSNGVYQLQYKTNLLQTNWINSGSAITASNAVLSVTNTINTDNQRFYRVQQQ